MIPSRLKQWNQATQERVALTSTVLRNMRSIKMTGTTQEVSQALLDSRTHELDRSAHFRWFVAFMNLFGSQPKLLSAPFAFVLFVYSDEFFSEGGLSAARAFTTLSLLELLTTPMGKVLQSLPHITAAFGCLDRIRDYLLLDDDDDDNSTEGDSSSSLGPSSRVGVSRRETQEGAENNITGEDSEDTVVDFESVSLRYKPDSPEVIRNATFRIPKGSLVMIVGPAGAGKTTLLRAVVGELSPSAGSVKRRYDEMAYCQQSAWIANTTVRKNIVGQSPDDDEKWYRAVCSACALDEDIASFPDGDEWLVGSGGITLSGGQKQRLVCLSGNRSCR